MKLKAYLFNADGDNKEVEITDDICRRLEEKQLLWINIVERDKETIEAAMKTLRFHKAPIEKLLSERERPNLDKFENYYRLFINSVELSGEDDLRRVPIDFLVAKNIVVSIQNGEVEYFEEFRNLEPGERHIGEMDAESFIATLLDLHVVSYYKAVEKIEQLVDKFDEHILTSELKDEDFFSQMVGIRRDVSKLRKWLMPHRDVFYALSRPDFRQIAQSDSAEHFEHLNQHFEGAIDSVENLRDTVLSLFDLYTTRASHRMNDLMKRLTFATIIFGALSVIAGVLGMNFEADEIFKIRDGFWVALLGMGLLALTIITIAKIRKLI